MCVAFIWPVSFSSAHFGVVHGTFSSFVRNCVCTLLISFSSSFVVWVQVSDPDIKVGTITVCSSFTPTSINFLFSPFALIIFSLMVDAIFALLSLSFISSLCFPYS